jgi:N-methylhydantoinase A
VIPGVDVEILSWILALSAPAQGRLADPSPEQPAWPKPLAHRPVFDPDSAEFIDTPVYWRAELAAGARINGPAIIAEDETATVVSRNFDARIDRFGYIELRAREAT